MPGANWNLCERREAQMQARRYHPKVESPGGEDLVNLTRRAQSEDVEDKRQTKWEMTSASKVAVR